MSFEDRQPNEFRESPLSIDLRQSEPMEQFLQAFMRYAGQMDERSKAIQNELGLLKREESVEIVETVKHPTDMIGADPDLTVIQSLLDDETVNDILINGKDAVYVERRGNLHPTDVRFPSDEALFQFAQEIVHAVGRKLDPFRPLVDARLKDGSRVNVIAPPLSIDGISISIRKFGRNMLTLDDLARTDAFSQQVADFLKIVAASKLNVVISGGTGSGKTTLLNAISQYIRPSDRVVTIEDSAELRLPIPHIVRLETMEADEMGRRDVTMRDLVKNALRMRPDRIIVGEVRGAEAFDMIQAMNTGHDGSLTTVHANTPRDSLGRIENMIGMANLNIPVVSIRRQIASAINLIVQVSRLEDGSRRIQKVTEIVGMEGETVVSQDLFSFKQTGTENGRIKGQIAWAGIYPRHAELSKTLHESGFMKV